MEMSRVYHTNYVRNSRAIGVMWGVFTICFAIINIVVFIHPQWIGDTRTSPGTGHFGLYEYCELFQTGADLVCQGELGDFNSILSNSFKAATILVGFSVALVMLSIFLMVLFFFISTALVFMVCGWLQIFSGLCMFMACTIYPVGWDATVVKRVCGAAAKGFAISQCGIRWTYILAIIGIFDAFVLATLAFVLAKRQAKLLPDHYDTHNGTVTKSYEYSHHRDSYSTRSSDKLTC